MKNILFIVLLVAAFSGWSCSGNNTEKQPGESAYDQAATETNSAEAQATEQLAYICPMECEGSASHEPGKCPVCAMDLVKNPNYKGTTPDSAAQRTN